jgi:hypothetical protein
MRTTGKFGVFGQKYALVNKWQNLVTAAFEY